MRALRNPVAVLFLATALFIVGTAGIASAVTTGTDSIRASLRTRDSALLSGWEKIWSGSFAGPSGAAVSSQWTYDTGTGKFGTGEVETMTSSTANVHLDGAGDLAITAIKNGISWTSGRIQTARQFSPPAGKQTMISAVIKQPGPANGVGYWPAFWMLGSGPWPQSGEIDIMEDINGLSEHSGTLHCGNLTARNADGTYGPCHEVTGLTSGLLSCTGCQSTYNTYSVIIDRSDDANQQIRWYLDGTQFWTVSEQQVGTATWTQAVDHDFSVILDLAVGGSWPDGQCKCTAPESATSSGGTMSISSVAVYEQ